jgi:ribosomal protein S18 acetylase RimI-like enzyme
LAGAVTSEVPGFSVRRAVLADAAGIAVAHLASWRVAYRGLLPQEFLDGLSLDERTDRWLSNIGEARCDVHVATDGTGAVVGFVSSGPSRDDDAGPDEGELYAVYLDPEVWGRGVGRLLLEVVLAGMTSYSLATLWVHEANGRARGFYERMGWQPDGATKHEEFGGVDVAEVRYRRPLP